MRKAEEAKRRAPEKKNGRKIAAADIN